MTLGRCFFTTLTLRSGRGLNRDADYVRVKWRRMLEFLRSKFQTVEWIKVVEVTQANQPHLHLALHLGTTYSGNPACEARPRYDERWRGKECDCLEHVLSRAWLGITGDSFVVDVKEIDSGRRMAGYLGKYLSKGIAYSHTLRSLGFKRAWARSKGWPFDQLRMAQTDGAGWRKALHTPKGKSAFPRSKMSVGWWLAMTKQRGWMRLGTDLAMALAHERERVAQFTVPEYLRRRLIA